MRIRTINKNGEHGMWKEVASLKDFKLNNMSTNYRKMSSEIIISGIDYEKLTPDTKRDYFPTFENATHEIRGDFEDHNYVIVLIKPKP